jgi:hypothetical protein
MVLPTVQEQIEEARRVAYSQGETDMRRKAVAMMQGWAMTHPTQVIRDDLWDLVEKLREEL